MNVVQLPRCAHPDFLRPNIRPRGGVDLNRKHPFVKDASLLVASHVGYDLRFKEMPVDGGTEPGIDVLTKQGFAIDITTSGASTQAWTYSNGVKYAGTNTSDPHTFIAVFQLYGTVDFGTVVSTTGSGNVGYRLSVTNTNELFFTKGGVQAISLGITLGTDPWVVVVMQNGQSITGYAKNLNTLAITTISTSFSGTTLKAGDGSYQIGLANGNSAEMLIALAGVSEIAVSDDLAFDMVNDVYQLLMPSAQVIYFPETVGGTTISINDTASGSDSISSVSVLAALTDLAAGNDAINLGALVPVSDVANGDDSAALAINVNLSLSDASVGDDGLSINVVIGISDSGTGLDLDPFTAFLATVVDAATGTDQISVMVQVPVADTAFGNDDIGALSALLSIIDNAGGNDIVSTYNDAVQLCTITFTITKRAVEFAMAQRTVEFDLRQRSMTFDFVC